jgi:hypothetical protein
MNYFRTSECSADFNKFPRIGSRRAGHLQTRRDGQTDTDVCKVGISFKARMGMCAAILTNCCSIATHDADRSQTISHT